MVPKPSEEGADQAQGGGGALLLGCQAVSVCLIPRSDESLGFSIYFDTRSAESSFGNIAPIQTQCLLSLGNASTSLIDVIGGDEGLEEAEAEPIRPARVQAPRGAFPHVLPDTPIADALHVPLDGSGITINASRRDISLSAPTAHASRSAPKALRVMNALFAISADAQPDTIDDIKLPAPTKDGQNVGSKCHAYVSTQRLSYQFRWQAALVCIAYLMISVPDLGSGAQER